MTCYFCLKSRPHLVVGKRKPPEAQITSRAKRQNETEA